MALSMVVGRQLVKVAILVLGMLIPKPNMGALLPAMTALLMWKLRLPMWFLILDKATLRAAKVVRFPRLLILSFRIAIRLLAILVRLDRKKLPRSLVMCIPMPLIALS